jgi:hypothetical protein
MEFSFPRVSTAALEDESSLAKLPHDADDHGADDALGGA